MFQQLALPLDLPQEITLGSFLSSPANGDALAWLDLWPNLPLSQSVIHGVSGCGKSHLAQAFAQKARGCYLSASQNLQTPDSLFGSSPSLLLIDDYDLICAEDWLFHVYNMAKETQTPVIYFGKAPPAKHSFKLADLESRMRSIHSIEILTPDEGLFKDLLRMRLLNLGLSYPEEVSDYLFRRLERSYEALQNMVHRIDTLTLQQQRPLTLPLLREILGETIEEEKELEEDGESNFEYGTNNSLL